MVNRGWFPDLEDDFEESVRIDREESDHRTNAIESYHVTNDSRQFLSDFIERLISDADDMRSGSNYWLYGYYGSGKSHLLTVLGGLMDTEWLEDRTGVWGNLVPAQTASNGDFDRLRDQWEQVHDEYHVIPVSINLLKYQGQKQRSFSEIILKHAHQSPQLTGIDDEISKGLSSQLDVAYFEDWYRETDAWADRQRHAATVLQETTREPNNYEWDPNDLWTDLQQYGALADVLLPELFEQETGTRDGYTDLQPSAIDPQETVNRLEEHRAAREEELDKDVKIVVLLDEVSLFIGTDFERLTELQTIAEKVDEIGTGDIQLVATAQAKIEDVQPKFAAHGADFSIVKDRFPHRHQLPSKHVGDIAKRRLFRKSDDGERNVRRILDEAAVKPAESLVYNEIKQNTKPPLDSIDEEELVECYPFLPYHAPLFLEILFNLRQEATDPAKSIFSGTARAILALMHKLLSDWVEEDKEDQLITLVDFYELVKPELRDILTQDMRVIEGTETTNGIADEVGNSLTEFDLDVAKAVVLLQHVHDIVPLNEGNIAVAVMSDLNGQSWISTTNRVEESLDRLQKFIRPTQDGSGPRYRFATQEERTIYDDAEEKEANPDWDAIFEAVDEYLWERITRELPLPESVPYDDSGDEYPVIYGFSVNGSDFDTTVESEGGLNVPIAVRGLHPEPTTETRDEETLYWTIDTDGLDDLRARLVEWWALRDAIETTDAPPAVDNDLEQRAATVQSKLVSAMRNGSYTVKDRTDIGGLSKAVEVAVDVAYPDDFHPMMLQVDDDRLQELRELSANEPVPPWAQTIQVPDSNSVDVGVSQTIQNNVFNTTRRQLHHHGGSLAVDTILEGIVDAKPIYADAQDALRAILWGYCRDGQLAAVDESGTPIENERVLDPRGGSVTRLKMLDVTDLGTLLEEAGYKETTESDQEGLIALREANEELRTSIEDLQENVQIFAETEVHAPVVLSLLRSFADELGDRITGTNERLATISAQGEDLEAAIEETAAEEEWFDEVSDVWERRQQALQRIDAELTVGDGRFEWVDEDLAAAVEERRDTIAEFDEVWWTTEGWSTFSQEVVTELEVEIDRSWNEFADEMDLHNLVERVDEHPWVVQTTDLPPTVHRSFERQYIRPLRRLRRWYETIDGAIGALSGGDSDAVSTTADDVADIEPIGDYVDVPLPELADRFDRLVTIVGDRDPADVDIIGIVPGDRQHLDERLEQLVEERELDVEMTASGVIVR